MRALLIFCLLNLVMSTPPCDPCAPGEYLYPMCTGPEDRHCEACVSGESFCSDGVYAQQCSVCDSSEEVHACTLTEDTHCATSLNTTTVQEPSSTVHTTSTQSSTTAHTTSTQSSTTAHTTSTQSSTTAHSSSVRLNTTVTVRPNTTVTASPNATAQTTRPSTTRPTRHLHEPKTSTKEEETKTNYTVYIIVIAVVVGLVGCLCWMRPRFTTQPTPMWMKPTTNEGSNLMQIKLN